LPPLRSNLAARARARATDLPVLERYLSFEDERVLESSSCGKMRPGNDAGLRISRITNNIVIRNNYLHLFASICTVHSSACRWRVNYDEIFEFAIDRIFHPIPNASANGALAYEEAHGHLRLAASNLLSSEQDETGSTTPPSIITVGGVGEALSLPLLPFSLSLSLFRSRFLSRSQQGLCASLATNRWSAPRSPDKNTPSSGVRARYFQNVPLFFPFRPLPLPRTCRMYSRDSAASSTDTRRCSILSRTYITVIFGNRIADHRPLPSAGSVIRFALLPRE